MTTKKSSNTVTEILALIDQRLNALLLEARMLEAMKLTMAANSPQPKPVPTKASKPPLANAYTLRQMIRLVLQEAGKPLRLSDIAHAVLRRGYQTRSRHFAQCVCGVLGEMEAEVERTDLGWALR